MEVRPRHLPSRGEPPLRHRRSAWASYGLALGSSAVAFVISRALHRPPLKLSPFILFYAAVAVSAWFGGFGPGLVAVVIGTTVTDLYLFGLHRSILLHGPIDAITLLIFLFVGVLISGLKAQLREALLHAEEQSAQARRSAERVRRLSEANLIGIFFSDMDGKVSQGNGEFCRLAGCTCDDLAAGAVNWLNLASPESRAHNVRAIEQLQRNGTCEPFEREHLLPDGRRVPVVLGCAALDEEPRACVGFMLDQTERRRVDDELREHRDKLSKLSRELLVIEERERRRVATVLHDSIGQNLLFAKLQTTAVAAGENLSGDQRERLATVAQLLDATIGRTRSLTSEVSPPVLYELGLAAAVRWLATQQFQQHGLRVTVREKDRIDALSPTVRLVLFDGVRELLANVVKHAAQSECEVEIRRAGEQVRVEVRDNGPGLSTAAAHERGGGFGLFNLRERLSQVGGRMEISTLPASGTHVTLLAPLEPEETLNEKRTGDVPQNNPDLADRRPPDDA